jgi:hypothetical protein
MHTNGLLYFCIQNRPYNTEFFGTYLNELFSSLSQLGLTNRTLVMDNVAFHHAETIRAQVVQHGHNLLFVPPYSPFLNPIENLFSKWKHLVCVAAPTSPERLIELINSSASEITPTDCHGFVDHMRVYFQRCFCMESIAN